MFEIFKQVMGETGEAKEKTQHSLNPTLVITNLFEGEVNSAHAKPDVSVEVLSNLSQDDLLNRKLPDIEVTHFFEVAAQDPAIQIDTMLAKVANEQRQHLLFPYLPAFQEAQQRNILKATLTAQRVGYFISNFEVFTFLSKTDVIQTAIELGFAEQVVQNRAYLSAEERKAVEQQLLEMGRLDALISQISILPELSHDFLVSELVREPEKYGNEAVRALDLQLTQLTISPALLESLKQTLYAENTLVPTLLLHHAKLFEPLNKERIVEKLIQLQATSALRDYRSELQGVNDTATVLHFLKNVQHTDPAEVAMYFFDFPDYDRSKILESLEKAEAYPLIAHFWAREFKGYPKEKLYEKLLETHHYALILEMYLALQDNIDFIDLFSRLLEDPAYHALLTEKIFIFEKKLGYQVCVHNLEKYVFFDPLLDRSMLVGNADEVYALLVKHGRYDLIASEPELLSKTTPRELFIQLVDNSQVRGISLELRQELFTKDAEWCIATLFEKNKFAEAATLFNSFDHTQLDIDMVARTFLVHGCGAVLFHNPELFRSVDTEELAQVAFNDSMVDKDELLVLAQYLTISQKKEIAHNLLQNGKSMKLAVNLHLFIDLGREFVDGLFATFTASELQLLLENYVVHKNYAALNEVLMRNQVTLSRGTAEFAQLSEELRSLLEKNNNSFAFDLVQVMKALFPGKKADLSEIEAVLVARKAQKSTQEVRKSFTELDVCPEIYGHYVTMLLRNKYPFVFDDTEIGRKLNVEQTELFAKVKEYIVVAVSLELQNDQKKDGFLELPVTDRRIYATASAEEVRTFFTLAKQFFVTNFFGHPMYGTDRKRYDFGGDKWSAIAQIGELFWSESVDSDIRLQMTLLNLAVSLQHNNKIFFDKDSSRIKLDTESTMQLLDFEASGKHTLSEFLKFGVDNGIIDSEKAEYFLECDHQLQVISSTVVEVQATGLRTAASGYSEIVRTAALSKIASDITLPEEVRYFATTIFSPTEGYTRNRDGPILLGRLLKTLQIPWTTSNGTVHTFVSGKDKLIYLTVEGFSFAFWYQAGVRKEVQTVQQLTKESEALATLLKQDITKAHYGYTKEGD